MLGEKLTVLTALIAFAGSAAVAAEKKVEILHMWTAGGEAAAVKVIKDALADKGYDWQDVPTTGTQNLNQVLRARVAAGIAPTAAIIHAREIGAWSQEALLTDLGPLAASRDWKAKISDVIWPYIAEEQSLYAVPTQMHRSNWLWYNKKIFDENGLTPPTTLEEFKTVGDALLAKGITPLAIGGQNWQEAALFDSVLVAVGGPEFYRKAIVEQDADALSGPIMLKAFEEFRSFGKYIDANYPGRDWNIATQMVMNGTAAMQVLGDYAKGEFVQAGLKADVDYGCIAAPGTAGSYLSVVDTFGFFASKDPAVTEAQQVMAEVVFSPEVQIGFSQQKGSIPARMDVDASSLDTCAQIAFNDRAEAAKAGYVMPSVGHFDAWSPDKTGVFMDVISSFFEQPEMTAEQAVEQLNQGLAFAN